MRPTILKRVGQLLLALLALTARCALAEGPEAVCDGAALEVSVTVANHWESDGRFFYQYDVTAENRTEQPVADWSARIPSDACEVTQCWNCDARFSDGAIAVEPLGYARRAEPGQAVTGIGMIVAYPAAQALPGAAAEGDALLPPAQPEEGAAAEGDALLPPAQPEEGAAAEGDALLPSAQPEEDEAAAVVAPAGRLFVSGGRLVNAEGQPVALRGVSTHGIGWFPEYVNADAFRTLRDDYGVNAIRIALYTEESGGYCTGGDRQQLSRLVAEGVACATELGMYAIIDWHTLSDGDPNRHADEAEAFWREMAQAYAGQDNVLYEICNEPNGGTTWASVRAYAQRIIPVIREYDGDAVILVGTPNWCQQLDGPVGSPVDDDNVMYTLHFYATTHGQALRDELERALDQGLPVFISECSICEASGNGRVDYASADAWMALIRRRGLSYVAWNLSNKDEAAALIRSDCEKRSGWTEAELSETGKWFLLSGWAAGGE